MPPDFNRVTLIGRLTRDPELRHTSGNTAVCTFGLAVGRKFKTGSGETREETLFVDCEAWGKGAELIAQYCAKGRPLFVEGRLKLEQWEDKQGGGKRSKHIVSVENFQFLGGEDKPQGRGGNDQGGFDDDDRIPF